MERASLVAEQTRACDMNVAEESKRKIHLFNSKIIERFYFIYIFLIVVYSTLFFVKNKRLV